MGAQLVVFPFDTVRKRLMNDGAYGRPKLYAWVACENASARKAWRVPPREQS